jgi:hypothetical protein
MIEGIFLVNIVICINKQRNNMILIRITIIVLMFQNRKMKNYVCADIINVLLLLWNKFEVHRCEMDHNDI